MASRVIHSTVFRVSYPHLDKPHAQNPTDTPKYAVSMMIPKTGVCPINNQPTSFDNVGQALNEVTMEEWGLPYDQAIAPGMGIQFPPSFKDGDTVFEKDQNGNPIPGQIRKGSAGMHILSVKNADPVGCVAPDGETEIHGSAIYAGSWARAQLEVSAYTGANGRVVSVKLMNIQLCYNDEKLGGAPIHQSAAQAFAGQAITDTNVQAGQGQQQFAPAAGAVPGAPAAGAVPGAPAAGAVPGAPAAGAVPGAPAAGAVPGAPAAGAVPGAPAAGAVPGAPAAGAVPGAPAAGAVPGAPAAGAVPGAPAAGAVPGAPAAGAVPGAPAAGAVPGAPAAGAVPGAPAAGAVPGAPAAGAVPGAPAATAPIGNTDPVIMNHGEASYAEYVAQGWTPELLIQHGKAQANYLNPAH
ncbi:ssDNA-binding protein [Pseudoalteromonas sp. DL2-H2.2]|uniref:ssDNA-binding protein n=1 Tax=Pseudoalteromonas sp. DL2-H2.2 TaxID=2908889 RepID=UPI002285686B|nr:ssDNA-binding protein [Pseudoalteromonas sp. DL2-H2.2]